MREDHRLIEDFLPIEDISAKATSEPRTKGHISTLHIWRARRPLVACRAAVYSALVPASQFVNGDIKDLDAGRARAEAFIQALCQYPGDRRLIAEAERHILEAHATRLSEEKSETITIDDIEQGRAPRPKVLDLFAGGGAIPLEAARLGCDSHALDLNPVAHLIELCTVTYPQRFGSSLADDVELWGKRVLERTRQAVSDLYATIPLPSDKPAANVFNEPSFFGQSSLSIVAYYWTRTVPCWNVHCQGEVPLYRQTWLRKKESGYVALKPQVDAEKKKVRFSVVHGTSEEALGFDPSEGTENTATDCPFCRTPLDGKYIRQYGDTKGFGQQLMCVIALNPHGTGKLFIADESLADGEEERQALAEERAREIEAELGNSSLDELIPPTGNAGLATGKSYLYGIKTFRQAFTPRQRCTLLTMAREIRRAYQQMQQDGVEVERAKAIATYLGLWLSRLTDRFNGLARWDNSRETIQGLTSMKRIAMAWDFPEISIFGGASGDALGNLDFITAVIKQEGRSNNPATCTRGSATDSIFEEKAFDAVVTDPPYYDNESYSELSDICYVWLRPTIGFLYPEHFATKLTPKKKEAVAAAYRQGGTRQAARAFYEDALFKSLQQAHRILKETGILVMVYAHKTTAGWSTLVDAIRRADFEVAEAWPIETETKSRVAHQGDAALASSIFLVARKRRGSTTGSYEEVVKPQLEGIVRERVETLLKMRITGADLIIAAIGAGLRAFTRFARVEYDNGEEVPAERFLTEVEGVVLDTLLEKIFGISRSGIAAVDRPSRFYVLWRYAYGTSDLEAGEAIVFSYSQRVKLDEAGGLTQGTRALVEKKKVANKESKFHLLDFTTRGRREDLGLQDEEQAGKIERAPLIDVLHRILWLIENQPRALPEFLRQASPDRERLRLVAQALAGPALKGGDAETKTISTTAAEASALGKLLANWRTLIEAPLEEKPLFSPAMNS